MESMFLTDQELIELTHRSRCDAQQRALRHMGIDFKTRPDGSVAVLRAVVEKAFGLKAGPKAKPPAGRRFDLVR